MEERRYMLEWDEGEPMLTFYRENGRLFNEPALSLDEARGELIRFYRNRIEEAQSGLANAEAITVCTRCGGAVELDWPDMRHVDGNDDDHEPETGE